MDENDSAVVEAAAAAENTNERRAAAELALAERLSAVPTLTFASVLALAEDPATVDATCAICLADMENTDVVKRLATCHHW